MKPQDDRNNYVSDNMSGDELMSPEDRQKIVTELKAVDREASKVEVVLKQDAADDESIDLMNVFREMGKRKKQFLLLSLIAAIIGLFIGAGKYFLFDKTENYASAIIQYSYEGIESGLAPDGNPMDVSKLKAPSVIEPAIAAVGLQGEEGITLESIRGNISIKGVIPQEAVDRISVIEKIAETDISYYEQMLEVSYFPARYVVTLENSFDGNRLSDEKLSELLDALLSSYRDYFFDTYANVSLLGVAIDMIDYSSYDYIEAIDVLESKLDIMIEYTDKLKQEAPDFRSNTTGLSFSDLAVSLEMLKDVDFNKINSYVRYNMLVKDRSVMAGYYEYEIKKLDLSLSQKVKEQESLAAAIKAYEKDPIVIVGAGQDAVKISDGSSEYYNDLITQKQILTTEIAEYHARIKNLQNRLEELNNSSATQLTSSYNVKLSEAESGIGNLITALQNRIKLIEDTSAEYFETAAFKTAFNVVVPSRFSSAPLIPKALIKDAAMFAILPVLVIMFIWAASSFAREAEKGKRRNRQSGGNEVAYEAK